jgi:outer membrane protein
MAAMKFPDIPYPIRSTMKRRGCEIFGFSILFLCLFVAPATVAARAPSAAANGNDGEVIPLTLDRAIRIALRNNRSLHNAAAAIESRELSLDVGRSEFDFKIVPSTELGITDETETIGAGISLEKKFPAGIRAAISPRLFRDSDGFSGGLSTGLSIPLLRGFGSAVNRDAVRGADFSLRAARRTYYQNQVNVVLETVAAFHEIVEQEELVRLLESQSRNLSGHAELARIKEKVGLATPIDTYRAEIRRKDVENQESLAREHLRNAEDRLKFVLSFPLESSIRISATVAPEPIRIGFEEAVEIAMANRIEMEHARDEIREARRRSEVAKHHVLPQLDLELRYDRFGDSDDFRRSLRFEDERWSLRLVSATDWARTSEKTHFRQSLIQVRTARVNAETRQEEIRREVRRLLEALSKAEERMAIRKDQIRQAEGKLALAQIKFNHNMADNFDIIEAETEVRQAGVNLLAVQTDYIVGTYRLRASLGTLLEWTRSAP